MFIRSFVFMISFACPLISLNSKNLDITTSEGIAKVERKIQCSLEDDEHTIFWWHGKAYGRRMGMSDKLLFLVEGMNIRNCATVYDKDGNYGWRIISREILLYKDKKTGEVLREWKNPYTNEIVEVMHVANDPVNQRPMYGFDRNGNVKKFPGDIMNGKWWYNITVPLYYTNVLSGDYQKYIGGTYRATEMFNFFGDIDSLLDENKNTADVQVGWARHSDWLPWMQMSGREGIIYMHTAGQKINSWDELSEIMKSEIKQNYPKYDKPPPLDDNRKNETSWTVFKKTMEKRGGPEPLKREFPH